MANSFGKVTTRQRICKKNGSYEVLVSVHSGIRLTFASNPE